MFTLQALATPPRPAFATAKLYAHRYFLCKMSFFGNDGHYRHKNQQMSCTWSVRDCVPNFAVVQRGV